MALTRRLIPLGQCPKKGRSNESMRIQFHEASETVLGVQVLPILPGQEPRQHGVDSVGELAELGPLSEYRLNAKRVVYIDDALGDRQADRFGRLRRGKHLLGLDE